MKYMLDTNMCIYAQKKVPSVVEKLRVNWQSGLVISTITLAELEYGVQASAAVDKNFKALQGLLAVADVVPFDDAAAIHYGRICAHLRRQGTPIGTMDMLIAAHARALGIPIVTNNVREFERVPDLLIENWIE